MPRLLSSAVAVCILWGITSFCFAAERTPNASSGVSAAPATQRSAQGGPFGRTETAEHTAGGSWFGQAGTVGKSSDDNRARGEDGAHSGKLHRQKQDAESRPFLRLENIQPLYTSPTLPGEGVWVTEECPRDAKGNPVIYRTFYRPSVEFPNAIVYMMLVDMSKVFLQYYVGSHEPAAGTASSEIEPEFRDRTVAVTNAMWMQRHSRGGGAIFRGKVLYPMVEGMATLISYIDGSVDIRDWTSDIPMQVVRDARQLQYLIVNNGLVVQSVLKGRQEKDAEIGLGFLLGGGGRNLDGKHFWYVAHRSAFGIRSDGNLVFAIGHHIGSKDLAKALVLAGCERGIHGDANPHNIVGNLYVRDERGKLVRRVKLSPEQSKYTLTRYEDGYTKDFFAFFLRDPLEPRGTAMSREERLRRYR